MKQFPRSVQIRTEGGVTVAVLVLFVFIPFKGSLWICSSGWVSGREVHADTLCMGRFRVVFVAFISKRITSNHLSPCRGSGARTRSRAAGALFIANAFGACLFGGFGDGVY